MTKKQWSGAMLCGALGCLCYGGGDWLMMYGDPTYHGSLFWLTDGVADIAPWRNTLAMALAFPGIILYGIALFSLEWLIRDKVEKRRYRILTEFGLTPWLALHLFYIMILFLFAWMSHNGYADAALPVCEALFGHFSWVVYASEVLMLPPFLYWFRLVARSRTQLPIAMAMVNPLVFYLVLSLGKVLLPDSAFRLGFINGLMSESMVLCFAVWGFWGRQLYPTKSSLK